MTMSDLAYDANGYPIRLSPVARKWLLRKHRHKKLPQVMFRNGQRVTLPIDAGLADLRHVVNEPGRFRLLALDETDQPVEDMPEAYVELDDIESDAPPAAFVAPPVDPLAATRTALAQNPLELLLLETVRANTELARATIDRIPDIMRASAHLVSASGALPRRPVYVDDFFEEEEDEGEPTPAPSLIDTFLRAAMMTGGNLGGFAKLLGAAVPAAASTATTTSTEPAATAAPEVPAPATTAPRNAATPANPQAHLLAILAQLTPDERAYAERVFAQLSPAAVQQWHELLLSMSVNDAVTMIRNKAAGEESAA